MLVLLFSNFFTYCDDECRYALRKWGFESGDMVGFKHSMHDNLENSSL